METGGATILKLLVHGLIPVDEHILLREQEKSEGERTPWVAVPKARSVLGYCNGQDGRDSLGNTARDFPGWRGGGGQESPGSTVRDFFRI
jgi:hypothetical protein